MHLKNCDKFYFMSSRLTNQTKRIARKTELCSKNLTQRITGTWK